ncbi:hypothetical protein IIA28_18235 [candidate division KSB1 bacterium]|nr:hypothetical protein [candidate division KSB1 bacterium]
MDKEIEIAPHLFFPAGTYNGQVPRPTIRCNEGDRIRFTFPTRVLIRTPFTFMAFIRVQWTGCFELVEPGQDFTYLRI